MEIINTIIDSWDAILDFVNYSPGPEDMVYGLFGSRKAKKAIKKESKVADKAAKEVFDFNFTDQYEGLEANQAQNTQLGAAQGYSAQSAELGTLGEASGYKAQGYDAQGYDAAQSKSAQLGPAGQVQQRNLAAGSDFLSNSFNNLQVGTAATDRQDAATDQALAAQQASGNVTGAGGATALAQAAAASKQGISANIEQQELGNQKLRAQGQQSLNQGLLSQSNQGQQFGAQQDQFNVGAQNQFASQQAQLSQQTNLANQSASNQASQFGASAQNQAGQFGAAAQNQAGQFNAGQRNQFAQSRFSATNQNNQFNASQGNQAAQFGAQAGNQVNLQQGSLDQQTALANQSALNQNQQVAAAGTTQFQNTQYGQQSDQLGYASGKVQAANDQLQNARNQTGALVGSVISAAGSLIKPFSDPRLKEDIVRTGKSQSGIPIYEWKYIGGEGRYTGTMSTEVPEYALLKDMFDGYDGVDYSMIDVEFKQIQ